MSEHDPLDPTLADLFRGEVEPLPPIEAHGRVLKRLEAALPSMTTRLGGETAAAGAHAPSLGGRMVALLTATFATGAAVGGIAVAVLRPVPPTRVVVVEHTTPLIPSASAPLTETRIESAAPADSAPPSLAPRSSRPHATSAPSNLGDDLAMERVGLDDARSRLAAGDAAGALERLEDHEQRHPNGKLAEEREALAIQALVQTGQYDAARARAARLRARWPNSVFSPAVDATLKSIR